MLHYKDRAFCSDTCRCATATCSRYITDEVRQGAKEMGLPIAWQSFRDGCKAYVEKPMTTEEKLGYLMESIRTMAQAIDNEAPDMMLWELRRVIAAMEEWDEN